MRSGIFCTGRSPRLGPRTMKTNTSRIEERRGNGYDVCLGEMISIYLEVFDPRVESRPMLLSPAVFCLSLPLLSPPSLPLTPTKLKTHVTDNSRPPEISPDPVRHCKDARVNDRKTTAMH